MSPSPSPSSPRRNLTGIALRIAGLVAVIAGLHLFIDWLLEKTASSVHADMLTIGVLSVLILAYALLIAVPFVPGIEIGLALLALRGGEIAPVVYLATVAGLMLAFWSGCKLPLAWLIRRMDDLRLTRTAQFLAELEPMPLPERLELLRAGLPARVAPHAIRWRYAGLAVLVNLPGSGLIGGGGGICLVAGMTGLFRPAATAFTLAVAVAPLPLLVWWSGWDAGWIFSPR